MLRRFMEVKLRHKRKTRYRKWEGKGRAAMVSAKGCSDIQAVLSLTLAPVHHVNDPSDKF